MAKSKEEKKVEQELNKLRRRAEKLGLDPDSIDPEDLLGAVEKKEEELDPVAHAARKAAREKAEDAKKARLRDKGVDSEEESKIIETLPGGLRKVMATRDDLKKYEASGILYGFTPDWKSKNEFGLWTRGIATIRI